MREIAVRYQRKHAERIRFNFASSGTLARQIGAGAPADLFISANTHWMDWLEDQNLIQSNSRFELAANSLVMVARKGSPANFDGQIDGRIAVGDFKSVPAGMYAREALQTLGWLDRLKPKLIMTANVRTALLYTARGEVKAGIVYATDARASDAVEIVGFFPSESHSPIVYPAALCTNQKNAHRFLAFLKSEEARAIMKKHGFQL